jgi:hypothetical protein
MWWWLLSSTAHAGCDRAGFRAALAAAESAFGQLDLAGLQSAAEEAARTLGCSPEPVDAAEAAAYHRVKALTAFTTGDADAALLAFHAARIAWPTWAMPDAWGGPGHPLHALWTRAVDAPPGGVTGAYAPMDGWLVVDGARADTYPSARPYVFQVVGSDGLVELAAWVPAGRPPPNYDSRATVVALAPIPAPPPVPSAAPTPPPPRREVVQRGLIAAGLATAVASAGVLGGAWVARQDYDDAVIEGDASRIERSYRWTNALSVTSGMLAGSGGMLIVGGLL